LPSENVTTPQKFQAPMRLRSSSLVRASSLVKTRTLVTVGRSGSWLFGSRFTVPLSGNSRNGQIGNPTLQFSRIFAPIGLFAEARKGQHGNHRRSRSSPHVCVDVRTSSNEPGRPSGLGCLGLWSSVHRSSASRSQLQQLIDMHGLVVPHVHADVDHPAVV
jgi:hypothetical protein